MSEGSSDALAAWPTALPLPLLEAAGAPRHATLAGGLENATMLRRRRWIAATSGLKVQWIFGINQFEDFRAFFNSDLDVGAAQFRIQLKYPYSQSLTEWKARFLAGYSAVFDEGNWIVQADLELRNIIAAVAPTPSDPVGWVPFDVVGEGEYVAFTEAGGYPFYVKV